MRIQHNISAMNSQRLLTMNVSSNAKNLEKLSSGYRINRAGDNAAGLAISEKMRGQIRGLAKAEQNALNAVNLLQTAEGGLNEIHDVLHRMRELSVQVANGTYKNEVDRENVDKELQALKKEVDRIASYTNYNGKKLLNGHMSTAMSDYYGEYRAMDPSKVEFVDPVHEWPVSALSDLGITDIRFQGDPSERAHNATTGASVTDPTGGNSTDALHGYNYNSSDYTSIAAGGGTFTFVHNCEKGFDVTFINGGVEYKGSFGGPTGNTPGNTSARNEVVLEGSNGLTMSFSLDGTLTGMMDDTSTAGSERINIVVSTSNFVEATATIINTTTGNTRNLTLDPSTGLGISVGAANSWASTLTANGSYTDNRQTESKTAADFGISAGSFGSGFNLKFIDFGVDPGDPDIYGTLVAGARNMTITRNGANFVFSTTAEIDDGLGTMITLTGNLNTATGTVDLTGSGYSMSLTGINSAELGKYLQYNTESFTFGYTIGAAGAPGTSTQGISAVSMAGNNLSLVNAPTTTDPTVTFANITDKFSNSTGGSLVFTNNSGTINVSYDAGADGTYTGTLAAGATYVDLSVNGESIRVNITNAAELRNRLVTNNSTYTAGVNKNAGQRQMINNTNTVGITITNPTGSQGSMGNLRYEATNVKMSDGSTLTLYGTRSGNVINFTDPVGGATIFSLNIPDGGVADINEYIRLNGDSYSFNVNVTGLNTGNTAAGINITGSTGTVNRSTTDNWSSVFGGLTFDPNEKALFFNDTIASGLTITRNGANYEFTLTVEGRTYTGSTNSLSGYVDLRVGGVDAEVTGTIRVNNLQSIRNNNDPLRQYLLAFNGDTLTSTGNMLNRTEHRMPTVTQSGVATGAKQVSSHSGNSTTSALTDIGLSEIYVHLGGFPALGGGHEYDRAGELALEFIKHSNDLYQINAFLGCITTNHDGTDDPPHGADITDVPVSIYLSHSDILSRKPIVIEFNETNHMTFTIDEPDWLLNISNTLRTQHNGAYRFDACISGIVLSNSGEAALFDASSVRVQATGTAFVAQIGANGTADQRASIEIPSMSSYNLGDLDPAGVRVSALDVLTREHANEAIRILDLAVNQVSEVRAKIGAFQNRLEHTIYNLGVTRENLQNAESIIRDVDMAKEMMEFTKNNILVQSSQAMLAQSQQLPQGVLSLLR